MCLRVFLPTCFSIDPWEWTHNGSTILRACILEYIHTSTLTIIYIYIYIYMHTSTYLLWKGFTKRTHNGRINYVTVQIEKPSKKVIKRLKNKRNKKNMFIISQLTNAPSICCCRAPYASHPLTKLTDLCFVPLHMTCLHVIVHIAALAQKQSWLVCTS